MGKVFFVLRLGIIVIVPLFLVVIFLHIAKNPTLFLASLDTATNSLALKNIPKKIFIAQNNLAEPEPKDSLEIPTSENSSVPISDKQNQIDDILEKIDILERQIADLQKPEQSALIDELEKPEPIDEIKKIDPQIQIKKASIKTATTRSASNQVYPKVLISEVQIAGDGDSKQEFLELFNPNNQAVDLTDWYVQRKTKTATTYAAFAPNTLFERKIIAPNGYFLIARQGYLFGTADVFVDNPLSQDNVIILKNPNGEIIDRLGFGASSDFQTAPAQNPLDGKSIGRIFDSENKTERDSGNNLIDFVFNVPTPRGQNRMLTDMTAPNVVFGAISTTQNNLSFTINFSITDTAFGVLPSGIAGYTFRLKKENGDWQEDDYKTIDASPITFSDTKEMIGQDETNYDFQIKIKDLAGNESSWQPEIPATTKISIFKKIVINQLQIDSIVGTGGTNDDWVQLYNPSNYNVDISQWSLQRSPQSGTISKKNFVSGNIIKAHGYFLIVRSNANQDLLDMADLTASILQLGSPNGTVFLVKNQEVILDGVDTDIVDKVAYGQNAFSSEVFPAPIPPESKSIARMPDGQDTDNNVVDFVIQDADPKNSRYVKDVMPPQITNIEVIDITENSAKIHWVTDELSTSQIEYGIDDTYGILTSLDESFLNDHTVLLDDLLSDTHYHYRIYNIDVAGNKSISIDQLFNTPDVSAPIISDALPSGILTSGTTEVQGSIKTNESAVCKYSAIGGQDYDQLLDTFLTVDGTFHANTINNLINGEVYSYYVKCMDVAGNKNIDDTVITFSVAQNQSEPPLDGLPSE